MLTPEPLCRLRFTLRDLPRIRTEVDACAASVGLAEPRRGEFVVAVDAVAANAVEHAGGGGRLLLRRLDDELECQVADFGPGFSEAVIPEVLPGLDGASPGRGLWLARLVTDRLSVASATNAVGWVANGAGAPAPTGALVTLAVRLPAGAPG